MRSLIFILMLTLAVALEPRAADSSALRAWTSERGSSLFGWVGDQTITLFEESPSTIIYSASPDGDQVVFTAGDFSATAVYVWTGADVIRVSDERPGQNFFPSWSHDGRLAWIYERGGAQAIMVWDGERARSITGGVTTYAAPKWSRDGRLAWESSDAAGDYDIYVWDGADVINVSRSVQIDTAPLWTPDDALIWRSGTWISSELRLWDGAAVRTITPQPGIISHLRAHGDGLVWMSESDGGALTYLWDGAVTRSLDAYPA